MKLMFEGYAATYNCGKRWDAVTNNGTLYRIVINNSNQYVLFYVTELESNGITPRSGCSEELHKSRKLNECKAYARKHHLELNPQVRRKVEPPKLTKPIQPALRRIIDPDCIRCPHNND